MKLIEIIKNLDYETNIIHQNKFRTKGRNKLTAHSLNYLLTTQQKANPKYTQSVRNIPPTMQQIFPSK